MDYEQALIEELKVRAALWRMLTELAEVVKKKAIEGKLDS